MNCNKANGPRMRARIAVGVAAVVLVSAASAQRSPETSPRDAAPIDLTGNWVSIVNEDWRWRMVTPPKGDYASVPLNERGREVADTWDESMDGSCKAYGAAGLLRMPTRLRIRWAGSDTLEIAADAGRQTRRLHFDAADATGPASLQGNSVAEWQYAERNMRVGRQAAPPAPFDNVGTLKVVTTDLAPGWLRRNGVPYSGETTMTEYFTRFTSPDDQEWFVVTTIVRDPNFLRSEFVTSSHFRMEDDGDGWNPRACRAGG